MLTNISSLDLGYVKTLDYSAFNKCLSVIPKNYLYACKNRYHNYIKNDDSFMPTANKGTRSDGSSCLVFYFRWTYQLKKDQKGGICHIQQIHNNEGLNEMTTIINQGDFNSTSNRLDFVYKFSNYPCTCKNIKLPRYFWSILNVANANFDITTYDPQILRGSERFKMEIDNHDPDFPPTTDYHEIIKNKAVFLARHYQIPYGLPYGQKFSPSYQNVCLNLHENLIGNKLMARYYEKDNLKFKSIPKSLRKRLHNLYLKSLGIINIYNKDMIVPTEMNKGFVKKLNKNIEVKSNTNKTAFYIISNNEPVLVSKKSMVRSRANKIKTLDNIEEIQKTFYLYVKPLNTVKDYENLMKSGKNPKIKNKILLLNNFLNDKHSSWLNDKNFNILKNFLDKPLIAILRKRCMKNKKLYKDKIKKEKLKDKLYHDQKRSVINSLELKFKQKNNELKKSF